MAARVKGRDMSHDERRRGPRISHQIPVTLGNGFEGGTCSTKNLSASGAYCTVRRFIPLMTKLHINLELSASSRIRCGGVVVRVNPPSPDPHRTQYEVAIFFNELTEHDRVALARYVDHHLQPPSSSG